MQDEAHFIPDEPRHSALSPGADSEDLLTSWLGHTPPSSLGKDRKLGTETACPPLRLAVS